MLGISDYEYNDEKPYYYGLLASGTLSLVSSKLGSIFFKPKEKSVNDIEKAINTVIFETTDLGKTGLKIKNMTSFEDSDFKNWPKFLNPERGIVLGKNAAYTREAIELNMEKMPLAAFHEIGHAFNQQHSKVLKAIQNMRPILVGLGILATFLPRLIKPTYKYDDEQMTLGEKVKNKVRKLSPAIAAACYAPVVVEEGIASIRASQFAKPLLEPENYKKMARGNICGFLTYFLGSMSLALLAKYQLAKNDC